MATQRTTRSAHKRKISDVGFGYNSPAKKQSIRPPQKSDPPPPILPIDTPTLRIFQLVPGALIFNTELSARLFWRRTGLPVQQVSEKTMERAREFRARSGSGGKMEEEGRVATAMKERLETFMDRRVYDSAVFGLAKVVMVGVCVDGGCWTELTDLELVRGLLRCFRLAVTELAK